MSRKPKKDLKWNIDLESIKDPGYIAMTPDYNRAKSQMTARTARYNIYGMVAKNKSIHERGSRTQSKYFSEGSTQYILRKSLANTIQRVPDGELLTQFDKASKEHIITEYIFTNKILHSEIENIDMLSNLTNTFKAGWIYGFAPVRTGFEQDIDNTPRISYNLESWRDIFIDADCKDIRRPNTVWHRHYMSRSDMQQLLNEETGEISDNTYEADTIKYCLDHELFKSKEWQSENLGDQLKGSTAIDSCALLTEYKRGSDEFITYVPEISAVLRRTPNYDPRKGIPWKFFVIEPDPDFPLGLSQVEFLLGDQQFQDLHQSCAYENILLAMEPPVMVAGWDTNPSSYRFEPRAIWQLGNNPQQVRVEPVPVDNGILSSWAQNREAVASGMLRQLNVMDGTMAEDSHAPGFSATPQGVEAQGRARDISINQYQKRIEFFFADWANQALRMYLNAMNGQHWMLADESTRRKLFDIDLLDSIDGDKVLVDFDILSHELINFKVRTGSLVERKEDQEREAINDMIHPIVQNIGGISDENRPVIENEILMPAFRRLMELADVDFGQSIAEALGSHIAQQALAGIEAEQAMQGEAIMGQQQQLNAMAGAMPPEVQEQLLAEGAMAPPMVEPDIDALLPDMGGMASPGLPPNPGPELPPMPEVSPYDLLEI